MVIYNVFEGKDLVWRPNGMVRRNLEMVVGGHHGGHGTEGWFLVLLLTWVVGGMGEARK